MKQVSIVVVVVVVVAFVVVVVFQGSKDSEKLKQIS